MLYGKAKIISLFLSGVEPMKLILASSSPRRISLLKELGIEFTVEAPDWETRIFNENPVEIAQLTALEKARSVARNHTEGIVIGADTIVVINGRVLGKPKDENEAKSFLKMLSGQIHTVVTGLALVNASNGEELMDYEVTEVKFKQLDEKEIEKYVATGEPMDKAGAYGIQGRGRLFVEWIRGDFYNVVGLPIYRLYIMLKKFGVDLLARIVERS